MRLRMRLTHLGLWMLVLFMPLSLVWAAEAEPVPIQSQTTLRDKPDAAIDTSIMRPPDLGDETPMDPVQLTADQTAPPSMSSADQQQPTIATSRPSFTDTWLTVPQGSFQMESGATYTDFSGLTKSWTVPESLLRLGITPNTEFRMTTPNYTNLWGDAAESSLINHFGDISVGLSHHFKLPGKVDMTLIPLVNLPTGANLASSNSVDPQVRMSFGRVMSPKLTLGGHLDTRWNTGQQAAADVVFNQTAIAYYTFNSKWCGFLEYSGFYPTQGSVTLFAQSGLLYLLTPHQQLDVRVARGLTSDSPDILVGFGYSFRVDGLFKP